MSKILIKRSAVAGKVPATGDLDYGELAMNTADGKIYFKKTVDGQGVVADISSAVDASLVQNLPRAITTTIDTTRVVVRTSIVNSIIFG